MSPHAKECQVEVHKELKIDLICMFAWNHLIRHVLFCVFCLDNYFWFWGIILLWRWKYDFKVTLIQVVQILFQSTFENSILGSLQSIQVFFFGRGRAVGGMKHLYSESLSTWDHSKEFINSLSDKYTGGQHLCSEKGDSIHQLRAVLF